MTRRDERSLLYLASGDDARRLDAHAIESLGMPGRMLMEVAGQGAVSAIRARAGGRVSRALVLCGPGNNAGDGYVVARGLLDAGWRVTCLSLVDPMKLRGATAQNYELFRALGGAVSQFETMSTEQLVSMVTSAPVLIDALFGTGLSRTLDGGVQQLLRLANSQQGAFRVALDVPSGTCATTGQAMGGSFHAALTTTFGLNKLGLVQFPGAESAGEVVVVPIGLPTLSVEAINPGWRTLDAEAVALMLPRRSPASHKGTYGRVGVLGGLEGMAGAAILAGLGALRSGAGHVTWFGPSEAGGVLRPPELLYAPWAQLGELAALTIGPGLGRSLDASEALTAALERSTCSVVLDADALNLMSPAMDASWPERAILTPHPAEAARLLGSTTARVQRDRPAALRSLVATTGSVVVLKGAGTLVGAPGLPSVVIAGSAPALATAGTGDVLSGVIAGLLAQGLAPYDAALCGTWLHWASGRRLGATRGGRGVLAGEVAEAIPTVMAEVERGWSG